MKVYTYLKIKTIMELGHVMACLINIYLFPKAGRFVYTFRRINLHMSTFHSACYVSYGKQVQY